MKDTTVVLPQMPAKILSATDMDGNAIRFSQKGHQLQLWIPASLQHAVSTSVCLSLNRPASAVGIIHPNSTFGSLAYNKPSKASSVLSEFLHGSYAAFDDDPNTYWLLGRRDTLDVNRYFGMKYHYWKNRDWANSIFQNSGTIEVDLGKEQMVHRVKLSERILIHSSIRDFEIQYKKGDEWITWARDHVMKEWNRELTPVRARYFRLVIHDREYLSGIREFQLF